MCVCACVSVCVCVPEGARQLEVPAELVLQEDIPPALVLMVAPAVFPYAGCWGQRLSRGLVSLPLPSPKHLSHLPQVRCLLPVLRLGAGQLRAAGEEPAVHDGRRQGASGQTQP